MVCRTELKIDLDIEKKQDAINQLKERIIFLNKLKILKFCIIDKIFLLKKTSYSAKIYINKFIKDEKDIILIQSILGDDYKHTAITFRDYELNIRNYNRMFDIKRYPDGNYKYAEIFDITSEIKNE